MDSVPVKRCSKCGIEKPASPEFFHRSPKGKDGLKGFCKACANADLWQRRHVPGYSCPLQPFIIGTPKTCTKCKDTKPGTLEYFGPQSNKYQPLRSTCRECDNEATRKHRQENPDQHRQRERNKRQRDPEKYRQRTREYRQNNLEKVREWERAKYRRNRRHYLAYHQAYYQANKDKKREYKREYRRLHPDFDRVKKAKRRALRVAAGGTFTKADVQKKMEAQQGRCYWCQTVLQGNGFHVDHIIALTKGGTNGPENICIACQPCNNHKYNKMPWEFAGRLL